MALRLGVLALLLANALYFAWSRWAGPPGGDGERALRAARQIRPETVRVLTGPQAAAALRAAGRPSSRTGCVEAGPFADGAALEAAEQALAPLPSGTWQRNSVERPATAIVYQGRFDSLPSAEARRAELRARQIDVELLMLQPAELAPGLALGRYTSRADADAALAAQIAGGVPGAAQARVAVLPAATEHWLRVEAPGPALVTQLAALPSASLAGGFRPCGS